MKFSTRFRPALEALENRLTPASILRYDGSGNLTVDFVAPQPGVITIRQVGPDELTITEGAVTSAPIVAAGDLTVKMPNKATATALSIDLNGNTFAGNVTIKTGNTPPPGGSTVVVDNGTIAGDLDIVSGNGSDNVGLGTGFAPGGPLVVDGSVHIDVKGSNNPVVSNFVVVGGSGAAITGDLTVIDANFFFLEANASVGENLNVESDHKTKNVFISLEFGSTVGGDATLLSGKGPGVNSVFLNGSITGNALVKQGTSDSSFDFAGAVGGDLTYRGGAKDDNATVGGTVSGNLDIDLGNGTNVLAFNSAAFVLGTAINIKSGAGADLINFNGLTGAAANLTASLGAGNDTVNFTLVPVLASAYLDGGSGDDVFFTSSAVLYPLTRISI